MIMDFTILKNSVKTFLLSCLGMYDYHHIPHSISQNLDIHYPLDYYIDFRPKIHYRGRFDPSKVFLLYINHRFGWCYHPITIFIYGLSAYQNYLKTGEQDYMEKMLAQLDWACKNQQEEGNPIGSWEFDFGFSTYDLKAGWVSGMAQGLGISLLLRAWILTQNETYLKKAELAFRPYHKFVSEGGIRTLFEKKYVFFEEYPSILPSFVLNGFISSILGIRDLYIFTENKKAEELWEECIETLHFMLPFYDLGYWSSYDLRRNRINIASDFYHKYHIVQLQLLHLLTGEKIFDTYAEKFESYRRNWFYRGEAQMKKVFWRLKRL